MFVCTSLVSFAIAYLAVDLSLPLWVANIVSAEMLAITAAFVAVICFVLALTGYYYVRQPGKALPLDITDRQRELLGLANAPSIEPSGRVFEQQERQQQQQQHMNLASTYMSDSSAAAASSSSARNQSTLGRSDYAYGFTRGGRSPARPRDLGVLAISPTLVRNSMTDPDPLTFGTGAGVYSSSSSSSSSSRSPDPRSPLRSGSNQMSIFSYPLASPVYTSPRVGSGADGARGLSSRGSYSSSSSSSLSGAALFSTPTRPSDIDVTGQSLSGAGTYLLRGGVSEGGSSVTRRGVAGLAALLPWASPATSTAGARGTASPLAGVNSLLDSTASNDLQYATSYREVSDNKKDVSQFPLQDPRSDQETALLSARLAHKLGLDSCMPDLMEGVRKWIAGRILQPLAAAMVESTRKVHKEASAYNTEQLAANAQHRPVTDFEYLRLLQEHAPQHPTVVEFRRIRNYLRLKSTFASRAGFAGGRRGRAGGAGSSNGLTGSSTSSGSSLSAAVAGVVSGANSLGTRVGASARATSSGLSALTSPGSHVAGQSSEFRAPARETFDDPALAPVPQWEAPSGEDWGFGILEYTKDRLTSLARGDFIEAYRWNAGGNYNGKPWHPGLPCDAHIVMDAFIAFLSDKSLDPIGRMHYADLSSNTGLDTGPTHPFARIVQWRARHIAPYYSITFPSSSSKDVTREWLAQPGPNNVFNAIVLFLYYHVSRRHSQIGRILLSDKGMGNIDALFKEFTNV